MDRDAYSKVLRDLREAVEHKRQELAYYEEMTQQLSREITDLEASVRGVQGLLEQPVSSLPPAAIVSAESLYSGLSVLDAGKKYLALHGSSSAKEIAEGLLAAGFQTKSKNFSVTIRGTFYRDLSENRHTQLKNDGGVWTVRVDGGSK